MKKEFIYPEVAVIELEAQNICVTSMGEGENIPQFPQEPGEDL